MERDDIILKAKAQIKQVNDEGCANFTENERMHHQDHANFNAFVNKAAEDRNNLKKSVLLVYWIIRGCKHHMTICLRNSNTVWMNLNQQP